MSTTFFQSSLFLWVAGLIICLPLIIILLGEWAESLEAKGSPLQKGIRYLRHITVPLLALLILLYQVLQYDTTSSTVLLIETVFWITVIVSTIKILGSVSQVASEQPQSLLARFPSFFFSLCRTLIIGFIIYYTTASVWGVDVSQLSAAFGVGALAISLALQDTISNLVSGLLLLADRPFQTGDWIHYQDEDFIVEEISWRATRLRSRKNTLTIVPNGLLSSDPVENLGRPGTPYHVIMSIDYSDDYPTNYIRKILLELLAGVDGIQEQPNPPFVRVNRYDDSVIIYDMEFWIDFTDYLRIPHEVKSNLYYVAKRHNLPRPSPVRIVNVSHQEESTPVIELAVTADMLQRIPLYNTLNSATFHSLTSESEIHRYGKGEYILRYGQLEHNLYIIQSGSVFLFAIDEAGQQQLFMQLVVGDIFGELTLLNEGESPISAIAIDDMEMIQMPHDSISRLLTTQPRFSTALNAFIEDRQRRLHNLIHNSSRSQNSTAENEWLDSIGEPT